MPPRSASASSKRTAPDVYSDAAESSDGAIRLCRESTWPTRTLLLPDQYNNPPTGRRISSTPPEIIHQTGGASPTSSPPWDSGTFMEIPRFKRDLQNEVHPVQPSSGFHGLEG